MATQSPFNRRYAELPPVQEGVRDLTPGGMSLANTPARPVGRSMNDPGRTAERMGRLARSTGNVGMEMDLMRFGAGQQNQERAFQQDMAAQEQRKMMFGLDQAAQASRDAQMRGWRLEDMERERNDRLMMFGLEQGQRDMEYARKLAQEEIDRMRPPVMGVQQIPGTDYVMPYSDGQSMGMVKGSGAGGQPGMMPPGMMPPGMMPPGMMPPGMMPPGMMPPGMMPPGMGPPWVPGAPPPYLPKLGEMMPQQPLPQRPGIEMLQLPGTPGMYAPIFGGQRLQNAPLFQAQPHMEMLPPGVQGPPEMSTRLMPWEMPTQQSPWQLTEMEGPMIQDPMNPLKKIPGPKQTVQVDRFTGQARPVKMPGAGAGTGGVGQPRKQSGFLGRFLGGG